jgi:hypothetical protein
VREGDGDAVAEEQAVRQTGQGVVIRLILHLLLRVLPVGDVDDRPFEDVALEEGHVLEHPQRRAVAAPQADLGVAERALIAQLLHEAVAIVAVGVEVPGAGAEKLLARGEAEDARAGFVAVEDAAVDGGAVDAGEVALEEDAIARLVGLAVGDVAADALHADRFSVAMNEARAQLERDAPAVFGADVELVARGRALAAQLPLHLFESVLDVLRHDETRDRQPHQLVSRVAGDPLAGDVHRRDAALEVVRVDEVERVLEELAVDLLAALQLLERPFALGDVLGDDHPHAPRAGEELERRHFDVDDRAVFLRVPVLMRPAALFELVHGREHHRHVLGGADVDDLHPQELLARIAVMADGGVVHGRELQRLEVVDPHRQRVHLEERAVAGLALSQRLFGAFALGEVAGDVDHADRLAVVGAEE